MARKVPGKRGLLWQIDVVRARGGVTSLRVEGVRRGSVLGKPIQAKIKIVTVLRDLRCAQHFPMSGVEHLDCVVLFETMTSHTPIAEA